MKKFWPLLVVVGVIIATFGAHYIQMASASSKQSVTFETLSGDESLLNQIVIEGNINTTNEYSPVLITNGKAQQQIHSVYERRMNLVYKQLVDNYKDFMRGKILDANHFYEDDEKLVYVQEAVDTWQLAVGADLPYAIDLLNKANHEVTSFTVTSKLTAPAHWITLGHVQVVGNELKLMMEYVSVESDVEIHLLTIDIKTQQLVDDRIIETIKSTETVRADINSYYEYYHLGPEKYLAYSMSTYDARVEQYIPLSQQFKILDFTTNDVAEIDIPQQMLGDEYRIVVLGHQLVVATIVDGEVVLNRYNIGQQQWLAPITLDAPYEVFEHALFDVKTLNDRLYVLAQVTEGQLLFIVDADSGETLYSGLIKPTIAQPDFSLAVTRFYEQVD